MKKLIDVNELIINPENYRFDPVDTEEQAIDLMLESKGPEILKIADHIARVGLDQAKDLRVLARDDKFLLLDGNRRITAIKCLINPKLVKDAGLREGFVKIFKGLHDNLPQKIYCYVYLTEEESSEWIRLDHTGKNEGVGQDSWGLPEQERFDEKFGGKLSLAMQTVDLLKSKGVLINTKKAKISTVNRLFGDPGVREFMGIDKSNGSLILTTNETEAVKRIKTVFEEIINNDLKVRSVYAKNDRERFIKNIFSDKPPILKKEPIVANSQRNQDEQSLKRKVIPIIRNTLIPTNCVFTIKQSRLNKIYHELKSINIDDFENAVAVLFRVFLEGSLDYYLAIKNIGNYFNS